MMIFERFGRFAIRYRVPILFVWVATAALMTLLAPNINDVASSDQADFLPADAPFVHAEEVYKATFPESFAPGNSVIVVDAHQSGGVLDLSAENFETRIDTEAGRFIDELVAWLRSEDAPEPIQSVASPIKSPATATLMIAPDNQVAIITVDLSTSNPDKRTVASLEAIDDWISEHRPASIEVYQTGAAPVVSNTTESIKTSVDRTIWVTVLLVIIMLLWVYRSPVSPFVPLTAVTVAYLITRGLVAWMGDTIMTITSYANVMMVVVMYGAGTDYCLFLISRFREEMADHIGLETATSRTVHLVGETITSSAGTIFVGFMAMIFAEMGIFNTSGPALALGIVLSLLVGLTFVPALLATLGERAFWPGHATHRSTGRLYEITSKQVSTYPLITILVIVAIMAPFSIYGINQRVTYNLLADLPENKDSVKGYKLMTESLGSGNILPLNIIVTGRDPDHIAADIAHLTDRIAALDNVADVRSLNNPLGLHNTSLGKLLRVDVQLGLTQQMVTGLQAGGDTTLDAQQLQRALEGIQGYLALLAETFPEVTDDPNLQLLQDLTANPLQLMARRDELNSALEGLVQRFESVEDPYLMPAALVDMLSGLPSTGGSLNSDLLTGLLPVYLADNGTSFKLEVIFAGSPTSYESMDTVGEIRTVLKEYQDQGEAVASGGSTINTDIRDTLERDFLRSIGFVLLGIFIVLLLMLHSVVAPLYLIGTVLLSFTCTLGLTNLVFKNLLDVEGLTWYVPFFMFVFLVALGMDYSIFLFGRIKEEVGYHGIREGVHVAVARTGAIITSAGMILAGTFAAMITGEIKGLMEVGFAVSVGVLIDTFIVRTVLDPALATLFGRWTWWPGGVPKARQARTSSGEPVPMPKSGD